MCFYIFVFLCFGVCSSMLFLSFVAFLAAQPAASRRWEKKTKKPLVFVGQNEDASFCAMIAAEIYFGSIFDHFWGRFGTISGSKLDPKSNSKFHRFLD